MNRLSLVCLLAGIGLIPAYSQKSGLFSGRWDLTVTPQAPNSKPTRKPSEIKFNTDYNSLDAGNSEIYLLGRYKLPVEYEKTDANDNLHSIDAIYSIIPPAVELPRKPGTFETFAIILVAR